MRISDWSSDVCSSDLLCLRLARPADPAEPDPDPAVGHPWPVGRHAVRRRRLPRPAAVGGLCDLSAGPRSEEHTSELQSLMRISYAVFCLKKKKHRKHPKQNINSH